MSEGATMVGSPVDLPHAKYVEIKITNDMTPAPVPANRRARKSPPPAYRRRLIVEWLTS